MKNIFLSLGLASVLFSCSKQNNTVIVDNPTDKAISFEVDGKPYKMEPNSTQEIELENGNHTLKTPEGKEINFEKVSGSQALSLIPLILNMSFIRRLTQTFLLSRIECIR